LLRGTEFGPKTIREETIIVIPADQAEAKYLVFRCWLSGPILAFNCQTKDRKTLEATNLYVGTLHQTAGPIPYDVCLPEAGLDWERVGPLIERYSIKLLGSVDEHWADSYQRVAASTPSLSRFHLDTATASVSFTCRATDGPVEVMTVLKILEEQLARVNREACLAAVRSETRQGPRLAGAFHSTTATRFAGKAK
jgi:hypothetical protein